jgi:hypothetical protein
MPCSHRVGSVWGEGMTSLFATAAAAHPRGDLIAAETASGSIAQINERLLVNQGRPFLVLATQDAMAAIMPLPRQTVEQDRHFCIALHRRALGLNHSYGRLDQRELATISTRVAPPISEAAAAQDAPRWCRRRCACACRRCRITGRACWSRQRPVSASAVSDPMREATGMMWRERQAAGTTLIMCTGQHVS